MMIAELVDEEDFRQQLRELGVPLGDDQSAAASVAAALDWCREEESSRRAPLEALYQALLKQADLVLPSIRQAIQAATEDR